MTGNGKISSNILIAALSCVLLGCASASSLKRGSSVKGSQTFDAPIDIVYQEAINTAASMQLLIVSEDYEKKEIRLKGGSYMTGMFLCSGNLIGVFLSEKESGRTRVEITEQLVLATQVLGCHDKAPTYMSQLRRRIDQLYSQQIRQERRSGTGFIVSSGGVILTAYHVIEKAKSIKVHLPDDSVAEAIVDKVDPANDLAVIKINKKTPDFLCLAPFRSARTGDHVFTFGFPMPSLLGAEAKYTDGVISSLSGFEGASSLLQITIPVQPGNSGGPVINKQGQVVGIITSTAAVKPFLRVTGTIPQNINWAIKADYARLILSEDLGDAKPLSNNEILLKARSSVCLIEVTK